MKSALIILRGNSGAGETTTANGLQAYLDPETLLVSQDIVRRSMLKTNDTSGNLAIDLIKKIAIYGNGKCRFVIVEAILKTTRYKEMLLELIKVFDNNAYVYYFDLPFKETLARHQKRDKVNEFGEKEMRSWWNEKDYLNLSNEKILSDKLDEKEVLSYILHDIL